MQQQPLLFEGVAARPSRARVGPKELLMSRLRITFTTTALLLAVAALTLNSLAQPPGGGGGRGGRGGPGGFGGPGGPGGGFGGPGGSSLLRLASNEAVQTELKLKDKQKAQIKTLNEKYDQQMQGIQGQMGFGPGGQGRGGAQGKGQRGGQNADPNNQGNGQVGQGGGGAFGGGGQGQDPNAQGGGGRRNRGNRDQNGQVVPEDPEVAAARAEQRAAAREAMAAGREAMNELRLTAETSLGRILDKVQVSRLKQIDLQRQGPDVVFREDMIEKLGIDEAQIAMLNEVRGGRREAQQETRKARGEMMKAVFQSINPQGNNGQNGGNDVNGGNGGNGQNGNRRNRGFDPAQRDAFQKYMERPEIKAQSDQLKSQEDKLQNQYAAAINKILTPRQRTIFKKMLGVPFDLSKLGGGNPWGGRGGAGPGNQASTKNAPGATKTAPTAATSKSDDDDDETPKAKSTTAAPAKAKAPTAAKPKSLREQRGEPPADDN